MVKNTQGGSSHKKFARKNTVSTKSNKLRVSEDEGEIYAIVTKMLGNNMFHCYCIDDVVRLGHIRGKFTGRGKRDNMVEGGKWVLIGLREWDVSSDKSSSVAKGKVKMQQCDLLEVYSDMDKQRLKECVSARWVVLDNNDISKAISGEVSTSEDDFMFCTDKDIERNRLINDVKSATTEKIKIETDENGDGEEDINFDDI
jgi:initiation factor 1A